MKVPDFTLIDSALFDSVSRTALNSPRKRSNHNFHELDEVYQRFLNVLTKGTYVQPHRHLNPPKPESFLSLKGELGFLLFDDSGNITNHFKISSTGPCHGIDIQPGVWHSLVTLTDICICFEGKSGPYDPTIDKEFADFAPLEGDPKSIELVQTWEKIFLP
jgi:cupin fold WbuC family metalloprotein